MTKIARTEWISLFQPDISTDIPSHPPLERDVDRWSYVPVKSSAASAR